jgi:hypothetical protein
MSSLSDTLTVGLVLILLFGSACLYLYTRIQQTETKINLLESILLDLKMTNELKSYPPLPVPAMTVSEAEFSDLQVPVPASKPRSRESSVTEGGVRPFSDDDESDDIITQMKYDTDHSSDGNEVSQHVPAVQQVDLAEPISHQETLHVSPSYDSMTAKELQALAKQRNISGTSGLRRAQLIDMLKQYDERSSSHIDIMDSIASSVLVDSAEELN